MDIRKLQRAIVDGLEDVKAQHIAVFNTEHLSSMFERVIIASGTSNRQTKALAASVRDAVKSRGMQVMSTEGEDNGEWIIVDCGAAVAHIMQPAIREYYHLEEIWGGKSVRIKIGATEHKLVKASEPEPAPKAATSSRAAPKKSAPRPPSLKTPKTSARKSAPRTPESKAENQAAAYKRVAAKKAPSRSKVTTVVASRKTPPRKTTARKVPR
ncbi:MAG: ribosome silencing factor [Burkholderiales bacterium]|nr:ribosome silencing factor [Burkholderiales bacterium]